MIHLILVDIENFKNSHSGNALSVYEKENSEFFETISRMDINTKSRNTDSFYTRLGVYRAFELLYPLLFNAPAPSIERDSFGKTFIKNQAKDDPALPFAFNISHTNGLCAIAFLNHKEDADGSLSKIGVDIECHRDVAQKDVLTEKYLKNINNSLQKQIFCEVIPCFFSLSENGKTLNKIDECDILLKKCDTSVKSNFFDGWTKLEALLKADGKGFGAFGDVAYLCERSSGANFRIRFKSKEYSLALALL